jgi:transglutaminase-like putative cysteine protease
VSERLGLSIRHHTGFTYDGVAKASYNEARMTPRSLGTQQVQTSKIAVRPVIPLSTHVDYFGSIVTVFDIQETHPRLEVESVSQVDSWAATLDTPLGWNELRSERLTDRFSEFLLPTHRTTLVGAVKDDIEAWQALADVHECAEAASAYVRGEVSYVPGATSVSSTAQEAWDRRKGVCQDITHVTIGLLRAMGIPSRYVSGYLYPEIEPEIDDVVEGQSHAWVEYFSGSWTGIDPTNGVRETERHIIVGHGRDYDDVPPLKGIYQGPESTQLGVVVEIRRTH